MPDPTDQVVTVAKAVPHYNGHEVPSRTIAITVPGTELHGEDVLARATTFFQDQAGLVHEALTASLPGGTLSNLFALMAADRASIFRVLDPAARIHEPAPAAERPKADDDVVDAEIDYSEEYTELAEMRLAVLAIHKQAEWAGVTGPDRWCAVCVGHDEGPVVYPCPTAQALGVTSGG